MILGRVEEENDRLLELAGEDDAVLQMEERPGPAALLRRAARCYAEAETRSADLDLAAALVARYSRKLNGLPQAGEVVVALSGRRWTLAAEPLADEQFAGWML